MVGEAAEGLGGLDGMVLNVGIGAGSLGLAGVTQNGLGRDARRQSARADALLPRGVPDARRRLVDRLHLLDRRSHGWIAARGLRRLEGRALRAHAARRPRGKPARHPRQRRLSRSRRHAARPHGERRATVPGATPIPFGRQATAWEIAYAALFFISDESVYVTGQTLAVDSGLTGL